MGLGTADFVAFFHAIHGYDPFPWQFKLIERLAGDDERTWPVDEWPDVLDLPTGSGKTAALDAAVFHLALRYECPERAALRIALVVDRRLVVDDAYERATKITRCLSESLQAKAGQCSVVAEVARRLQYLACASKLESDSNQKYSDSSPVLPLVAQRLRGGVPLESEWARTPTQPTILCSTVDQVGSRLLFRGYGISNRMKPVHAGLLGKNTLILLDEAHLSDPFRETVQAVRNLGNADVKIVLLSATPGIVAKRSHQLTKEDYFNSELRKRLYASKPAELCIESGDLVDAFAKKASDLAERLTQRGMPTPVVGVVVNRVRLARQIFERLQKSKPEDKFDVLLLIGRSRGVDSDKITQALRPFRTGNASRTPKVQLPSRGGVPAVDGRTPIEKSNVGGLPLFEQNLKTRTVTRPLFVVATQCLEVGVDLDLDGLVTQAASFDALRQRFGRLNRAGRLDRAESAILVAKDALRKTVDDPIYGNRLAKTWEELQRMAHEQTVDFGIVALERRLEKLDIEVAELMAPKEPAPIVLPAYIDLWSQTSPPPTADPDVGLFLHGVDRRSTDVALAWRGDIEDEDLLREDVDLKSLLRHMPPRAGEIIQVPLWSAKAWLSRRQPKGVDLADISDVPERVSDRELDGSDKRGRPAFRWAGVDDPRTGTVYPDQLRPGDVLVVPTSYGGCDPFGWNPEFEKHVTDVADEVAWPFRGRRHVVRIAKDVATRKQWGGIREVLADDGTPDNDVIERLLDVLPSGSDDEVMTQPAFRSIRKPVKALLDARGKVIWRFPYSSEDDGRSILLAPHGLQNQTTAGNGSEPTTEDDVLSYKSRRAVSIDDHTDHVTQRVARFVATLNLPSSIAHDLKLAAFLHDAGKADHRFQKYLSGGDSWNRQNGLAMAKSGRQLQKGAWERTGLPKQWRHEALSVLMAQAHPRFVEARDPKLVLWLIGTHHGLGRPFFDFVDSDEDDAGHDNLVACLSVDHWKLAPGPGPQSMAFHLNGTDWVALYQQLRRRYGSWELAHLEAVLRLADHRASEFEQRE